MKKKITKRRVPKNENVDENRFPAIKPRSISFNILLTWKFVNFVSFTPSDIAVDDTMLLSFISYCGSCSTNRLKESIMTEVIPPNKNIIINKSSITKTESGILYLPRKAFRGEKTKKRKYAISNGMKILCNSFKTIKITTMPIASIKKEVLPANLNFPSFTVILILLCVN